MLTQMNADKRRYIKTKTRFPSASICVYLCLTLCVFPVFAHAQETITVAVASSFYSKAQHISKQFEATHDVKVRLVSGATGRLFNQIKQGAPFDIWVAADAERPALLNAKDKRIGEGYVGIQVGDKTSDLHALQQREVQHIAIANPDVAPFGLVAKSMLQSKGLWKELKPKFVYAQNAMQAAMMVHDGLVDAGFVPASRESALASVPYVAVLLSKSKQAQALYQA